MRTIKFRAWDKNRNRMYNNVMFDNDTYLPRTIKSPDIDCLDLVGFDNCILEQFTGLTDKNGKDIYEGDIVDCDMSFEGGSLPHRGKIIYSEKFGAFATQNDAGDTLLHNHILSSFKIIGNIHENPELLK